MDAIALQYKIQMVEHQNRKMRAFLDQDPSIPCLSIFTEVADSVLAKIVTTHFIDDATNFKRNFQHAVDIIAAPENHNSFVILYCGLDDLYAGAVTQLERCAELAVWKDRFGVGVPKGQNTPSNILSIKIFDDTTPYEYAIHFKRADDKKTTERVFKIFYVPFVITNEQLTARMLAESHKLKELLGAAETGVYTRVPVVKKDKKEKQTFIRIRLKKSKKPYRQQALILE